MVLQAAGGADDDVAAGGEQALLAPGVHAADAGDDAAAGLFVEPGEFGVDLQGQLARGGDDQDQGQDGVGETLGVAQNGGGEGEAKGHCFARAGLRGDQKVAVQGFRCEHGELDFGGVVIAARGQGASERRIFYGEGHGGSYPGAGARARCACEV